MEYVRQFASSPLAHSLQSFMRLLKGEELDEECFDSVSKINDR
jgi:hypothetical protein